VATNTIKKSIPSYWRNVNHILQEFFKNFYTPDFHLAQHPFRAVLPAQPWTPHALFPPSNAPAAREHQYNARQGRIYGLRSHFA